MSGNGSEVLFRENQIFCFLCFFVFMRSFWHRKILRKKMVKIVKVRKINYKLLFSGKKAPENIYEGE